MVFSAAVLLVATGLVSAPFALAAGICFGIVLLHPYESQSRYWSKLLLQLSVVGLGFGMNFREVLQVGRAGVGYTAIGVTAAMAIGLLLGRTFKVRPKAAFLIAAGTAICGGSAIAALAPITNPDEEELAMSMGTVFTLNCVALFLFPTIGLALHMTQTQFGFWSALAIHDTSSVVGAASRFGPQALGVGTVVKLTRALWVVPVALITSVATKSNARVRMPWFILFFLFAAAAKTWLPISASLFGTFTQLGHVGLAITLFLIGTGISVRTIKQTGVRVILQGTTLWVIVAAGSLLAILTGWISL
jgi:uncharacterized integral membrane protein (TIGR00698 family)